MLSDIQKLHEIIDRVETGIIKRDDIIALRGAVTRLDEMDDLVEAVCSCRTQEIPILRAGSWSGIRLDDDAPGRP